MSKYTITKTNGRPIARKAQYFVLRVDYHGYHTHETLAARLAVEHYVLQCRGSAARLVCISSPRVLAKLRKCADAAAECLNSTRAENMEP
jgi:hypothetical protein